MFKYIFAVLVLGLISFIVAKNIDLVEISRILAQFPKLQLVTLVMLAVIILNLKAWRFLVLLRRCKIPVTFWQAFKVNVSGNALSPLPGGEMFRSVLLFFETGKKVAETGSSVLAQAFLELATAVLILLVGSLFYEDFLAVGFIAIIILGILATLVISPHILTFIYKYLPKWSFIEKGYNFFEKSREDYRKIFMATDTFMPSATLAKVVIITLSSHLVGGLLLYWICKNIGVEMSLVNSIFIYAAGIVISGIGSISPGGIGFTEGGMVGAMVILGANFALALAAVLLFRVATLLLNIILGLSFIGIFYSKPLLMSKSAT